MRNLSSKFGAFAITLLSFPLCAFNGGFLQNARLNANWGLQVDFNPVCNQTYPEPASVSLYQTQGDITTSAHDPTFECATLVVDETFVSPGFILSSALPSAIAVDANAQSITTGTGTPSLYIYDRSGNTDATLSAISFTSTTATFPASFLGGLAPDMYAIAMVNDSSAGFGLNYLGNGWFVLGQDNQSYPAAFGVDALNFSQRADKHVDFLAETLSRYSVLPTQAL